MDLQKIFGHGEFLTMEQQKYLPNVMKKEVAVVDTR